MSRKPRVIRSFRLDDGQAEKLDKLGLNASAVVRYALYRYQASVELRRPKGAHHKTIISRDLQAAA